MIDAFARRHIRKLSEQVNWYLPFPNFKVLGFWCWGQDIASGSPLSRRKLKLVRSHGLSGHQKFQFWFLVRFDFENFFRHVNKWYIKVLASFFWGRQTTGEAWWGFSRSAGIDEMRSVLTLERYELKLLQTYRLGWVAWCCLCGSYVAEGGGYQP